MARPEKYPWGSVNWRETNQAIAQRLGCTEQAVRQARVRYGTVSDKPPHPRYDFTGVDWTRPKRTIAEELGCALETVYKRYYKQVAQ